MLSVKKFNVVFSHFKSDLLFKLIFTNFRLSAIEDGRDCQSGLVNNKCLDNEPHRTDGVSQANEESQHGVSTTCLLTSAWKGQQLFEGFGSNGNENFPSNKLKINSQECTANASWWYLLCTKCRQKELGPGWEPSFWQSVCPYPFCPTYRHIARCFSLVLLILLAWGIVFTVIGDDAAPGGQLFDIAMLVISAHFGGYIFRMLNLPGLVGMLAVGIVYQNIGLISINGVYLEFCSVLRKTALVIILTRAGLDLDPKAMRRLFGTVLKLGLVPWMVEAGIITATSHVFLDLPWMWAVLAGVTVAAVSPAVVVPCLFRLRSKGYGVAKGIPTVVIAVSGIDDAASVAAFGIIESLMFSKNSLLYNLMLGPLSVLGGLGFGVMWGLLSKFVPEKDDPFVVPLRVLMLLGGGMIAVFGSEHIHLEGAGPLGVVAAAFVSTWAWSTQVWEIEDNPVATAFEVFWMVFEPVLFSLTGTQLQIDEIDSNIFTTGLICISVACILRMITTVLVAIGAKLNLKEKCFISLSWMAKASVQAALAPVALDIVKKLEKDNGPEHKYAGTVLMVCVLSIALTAPLGAVLIMLTGPRLLTKTAVVPPEGWCHSARPSLRDLTVADDSYSYNCEDTDSERASHNSLPSWSPPAVIVTPPRTANTLSVNHY